MAARQPIIVALLLGAMVLGGVAAAIAASAVGGAVVMDGSGAWSDGAASPAVRGELVVEVAGAVAKPGVYRLAAGSRVGDAIALAGGFGPRVAADRVELELNLATPLADGSRIVVPSRDTPSAPSGVASGGEAKGLLDLNAATQAELEALPGIGPVTATKIIESRTGSRFRSVDELRSRGLVGEKTFARIRPLVSVG